MVSELVSQGFTSGDCDDMAILLASIAVAQGLPSRFVAIRSEPDNPEFTHVFLEVYDRHEWRPVDPSVPYGTRYMQHGVMTGYV